MSLRTQRTTMRLVYTQLACGLFLAIAATSSAAEPVLDFVEGLRQRRYYDTALQYLDQVEQLNLAPEVKEVLSYERAQTLLVSSQDLANLDEQRKRLDAAQAAFEDFVKASSNHPLAGRANTARGEILTEKARVEIWDGDKPSNEGSRDRFRETARKYIQEARRIFEQAADQHKRAWEAFPTFISEDQFQARKDRDAAETQYMEAQLDLAQCTYWESQTYPAEAEERKKLLETAAFAFEEIHTKYRSQVAGLFARIWQGKCFEERGDIRIALGLYEEILGHEGSSDTMRNLKDRALRFRLICLNHESRKDYQLVADEGEAWIKEARARSRTNVGLGIQYEVARALEMLGTDRTRNPAEQSAALNRALTYARTINRFPGELKVLSSAVIQRVMVALNRTPGDPKDFDTAYGSAGVLYEEISGQNDLIKQAKAAGKMKEAADIQQGQIATAAEMARIYDLAIKLANGQTSPQLLDIARLRLAYGYLLQSRFLDAAIVADYQMVKFAETSPETAREAGFIAMTAFDYAYNDAPEDDRQFEANMVLVAAEKLAARWPDSDRANDARNAVAKIYWAQGDLVEAANWWLKIPEGTGQYVDSRVRAGKAYWRQYILQASLAEDVRPTAEVLANWKAEAVKQLETGLNIAESQIPDEAPMSDDLISSKLTLAGIRNLEGDYDASIALLTAAPHPVTAAVDVPKGQARPKDPSKAQSREMASIAYQTLLRAYIGKKELEKARDARIKLEEVAGSEDAAALTQVFVAFGAELQSELERLRAGNEVERLKEVREGFESFLNDLFQRQEGQTFYSLLWIAETYASLADGTAEDPAKANEYYDKAAQSYRSIISKGASDASFLPNPNQAVAAKLLLVKCLRRKRDYPAAEQSMLEIVKELPEVADVQFEAAKLYQDWGASGAADFETKLETAIYGTKKDVEPKIWGWTYTAQTLQRALRTNPELEGLHFDARYALAESELELGTSHSDPEEAGEHLERARAAITRFLRSSKRWPDEQYARFNALYRKVLGELSEPVVDLPRESGGVKVDDGPEQPGQKVVAGQVAAVDPVPEGPKSNLLLIGLVLVAGTGAIAGLFFLALKQSSGGRPKYEVATDGPREAPPVKLGGINIGDGGEPTLGNIQIGTNKPLKPAVKKSASAPQRPATAEGQRPASPRSPASAEGAARPRPVNPEGVPVKQRPPVTPGTNPTAGAPPAQRRPATPGDAPRAPRPAAPADIPAAPKPATSSDVPRKPRPASGEAPPAKRPPAAPGETPPVRRPRPEPPPADE